jgi:hypothetical protein
MKTKYLIAIAILILIVTVIAYLIIYSDYESVPFKTKPTYELSAYYVIHSLESDSIAPLRGTLYATFDKHGNCKLIQKYEEKMIFKHFKIPTETMSQLDSFFSKAPIHLNTFRNGPAHLYSGPTLRLIYMNESISKTLDFILIDKEIYCVLFEQLYDMTLKKKYETYNDTIAIKEMRMKMLKQIRNDYLKFAPQLKELTIE